MNKLKTILYISISTSLSISPVLHAQDIVKEKTIKEADAKAAKIKAIEAKEAEAKAAKIKAVEAKEAETRAAAIKEAEAKTAQIKAIEAKEAEAKTAQIKAIEAKEAEAKTAQIKAIEAKEAEAKAAKIKAVEAKEAEATTAKIKAVEAAKEAEAKAASPKTTETEKRKIISGGNKQVSPDLSSVIYAETINECLAYNKELEKYVSDLIKTKNLNTEDEAAISLAKEYAFKVLVLKMHQLKEDRKNLLKSVVKFGSEKTRTSGKVFYLSAEEAKKKFKELK